MPDRPSELLLAASAGGHLDLLLALAPEVVGGRQAVWVTSDTSRGRGLRSTMPGVELIPEYGRDLRSAARNVWRASRIIASHRPRTVVTSGAGLVVPLVLLARLTGSRVVYVETMARVMAPSKTARVLSRLADRVIVQWPELAGQLPRAIVCRPLLLEKIPEGERPSGEGTVVAVGTHEQGFARLLEIVERATADGILPAPVFVQSGPSDRASEHAEMVPYVSSEELQRRMGRARVIVCHGGAGIISSALSMGRTPIVVPRRAALAEHVDDHQYELAHKLADWNVAVTVEEAISAHDVARATAPLTLPVELRHGVSVGEVLARELRAGSPERAGRASRGSS